MAYRKYTLQQYEHAKELREKGLNNKQIAKATGILYYSVCAILKAVPPKPWDRMSKVDTRSKRPKQEADDGLFHHDAFYNF